MTSVAAIKIAQKKAFLTDHEYRELLQCVAGVDSATKLDETARRRVLATILKRGNRKSPFPEKTPSEKKIWALWYELKPYLPEVERSHNYLLGICMRANGGHDVCQITRLDQLTAKQIHRAIEALKRRLAEERWRFSEYNPQREVKQ